MNTPARRPLFVLTFLTALAAGCEAADREEARPRGKAPAAEPEKPAEAKKVLVAKNIFLEVRGKERRVLVSGEICLREGQLELFMCRKQTKEHEAVVTADVDARKLHEALLLAGAEAGSPVRFAPEYRPAHGTTIKVSVRHEDKDGKLVTVPARSWVKNMKTGKPLGSDWVFAGSRLVENPLEPGKKHYLANDGDLICVSNFETALLDLPIKSPKDNADLIFVADTERIPPVETKVVVVLEPVLEGKTDKK
jgi:hypothetical protein